MEDNMTEAQTEKATENAKQETNEKDKKEKTKVAKLTKEQFFEHLDNLTVLELADYIKEFEDRYGVSAAAVAAPVAAGASRRRRSR